MLERCWNDDILLKTHFSSIPYFQDSNGASVHQNIGYDNSYHPKYCFWADVMLSKKAKESP
jgi:hypothetical protein